MSLAPCSCCGPVPQSGPREPPPGAHPLSWGSMGQLKKRRKKKTFQRFKLEEVPFDLADPELRTTQTLDRRQKAQEKRRYEGCSWAAGYGRGQDDMGPHSSPGRARQTSLEQVQRLEAKGPSVTLPCTLSPRYGARPSEQQEGVGVAAGSYHLLSRG